jgi:membrane protein
MKMKKFVNRELALLRRAQTLPYIGVLIRAANRSRENFDKDIAAGITYYTFLSLFPLILGLAALGGFFLKSAEVQLRVHEFIVQVFPVSTDFVARIFESLIESRGAAGVTSILVLLWSGNKMIGALTRGINRALGQKRPFAMLLTSLRYFGLTLILASLVFLSMALSPAIEILADLELEMIGDRWNQILDVVASRTVGLLLTGSLISAIYWLAPYTRLPWRSLLPGILVATVLIEIGKQLSATYMTSAAGYSAVYGSVSSIIVLLLWLYFAARVVLYGAELIKISSDNSMKDS